MLIPESMKQSLEQFGKKLADIHERVVVYLEPEFPHNPGCPGGVPLHRNKEYGEREAIIFRVCDACEATDNYTEPYPNISRGGW